MGAYDEKQMTLTGYQQDVLDDLNDYMNCLEKTGDLGVAFDKYWKDREVDVSDQDVNYLHPYRNDVEGVPNVTVKVPTAGGKTFIACNAINTVFSHYTDKAPKAVVWFVPWDTILKQTYRNLSNPDHPYRRKIDSLFNSRVNVLDKEQALMGKKLKLEDLQENLTIFVFSVQSFATNSKDGRRVYRENGNLNDIISKYNDTASRVEGADEYSLMNLIYHLNPLVIVDESHNFEADLRVDMLRSINPRFILDLTATPKPKSNVISFVDAYKLKDENMVKLPVIVYNMNEVNDVLASAIRLRDQLQYRAEIEEKQSGKYIRPIVLLQAQPRTDEDNETFDRIKARLIGMGVPETQIRIKTAEKDEIKNEDLMSRECEVRYIITVNALKEGWDCPFAYILASMANKTSRVDVEQILGRILRLPHTTQHNDPMLNMSYVFTCSDDFRETLDNITKALNNAGFSDREYKLGTEVVTPVAPKKRTRFDAPETPKPTSLGESASDSGSEIQERPVGATISTVEQMAEIAIKKGAEYDEALHQQHENNGASLPPEVKRNTFKMKDTFIQAKEIELPQFFIEATIAKEKKTFLLKKENLSEGFDLTLQDKNINFVWTQANAVEFDLDETSDNKSEPVHKYLDSQELDAFRKMISTMAPEEQKEKLVNYLVEHINTDEIAQPQIRKYVTDIIDYCDRGQVSDIISHKEQALTLFKSKINGVLHKYRKDKFNEWVDMGKVKLRNSFRFPSTISSTNPTTGIPKSLYGKEDKLDSDTEHSVISAVAALENVEFWHRNISKNGLCINGFINHYPDFIVKMRSGKIVVIEVKGDKRQEENADRLELGTTWANMAGINSYRYFMVFESNPIKDAITIQQLVERMKEL